MQWGIQRKASAAWARVFFPCEQKTGRSGIEAEARTQRRDSPFSLWLKFTKQVD